jgi:hypothetical protein
MKRVYPYSLIFTGGMLLTNLAAFQIYNKSLETSGSYQAAHTLTSTLYGKDRVEICVLGPVEFEGGTCETGQRCCEHGFWSSSEFRKPATLAERIVAESGTYEFTLSLSLLALGGVLNNYRLEKEKKAKNEK